MQKYKENKIYVFQTRGNYNENFSVLHFSFPEYTFYKTETPVFEFMCVYVYV